MSSPSIENGFFVVDPPRPEDRRADREVVLLLHGRGETSEWRYPQWRGNHWDYAHPPTDRHDDNNLGPPNLVLRLVTDLPSDLTELLADLSGADFSLSDLREDVRCWTGLRTLGHTVVSYSQRGPQEKVAVSGGRRATGGAGRRSPRPVGLAAHSRRASRPEGRAAPIRTRR